MPSVREVNYDDFPPVAALLEAAGMGVPTLDKWHHVWDCNPANLKAPTCRGWVLEEGGRVVGFASNVAQEFTFGGRTLASTSLGSLIVEPEYRGKSMQLILPFTRQAGVDLLLNTTCSPETSQIFPFLKFARLPQADYDRPLYWILDEARFLVAGLRKKGYARPLSRVAGVALAPALWAETRVRGRRPRASGRDVATRLVEVDAIGAEFDDLDRRLALDGRTLHARRDSATLRWHFAPGDRSVPPLVVAASRGGTLVGYAAVIVRENPKYDLRRAYLADLVVDGDDPEAVRHLLAASAKAARGRRAALIEAVGFPERIRRILRESGPRTLFHPAWPYFYRAAEPALHGELADATRWHACLYDGDGSL